MRLGRRFSVVDRPWPAADPAIAREEEVELAVQVNGKVRERITVPAGTVEDEVRARALEAVQHHLDGKRVIKVVVVPGRLVNVVIQ
jgi:leucyl-tRNA synthetase